MRKPIISQSFRRWKVETPWGGSISSYALCNTDGLRMGDVTIEYDKVRRRTSLFVLTSGASDVRTGYGCWWAGQGEEGWKDFLLSRDCDTIAIDLAAGHGEHRVFRDDKTRKRLADDYDWTSGDADRAGEALCQLEDCECEADFYTWAGLFDIEDVYKYFVFGRAASADWLAEKLLPELKRVLREEAQAE